MKKNNIGKHFLILYDMELHLYLMERCLVAFEDKPPEKSNAHPRGYLWIDAFCIVGTIFGAGLGGYLRYMVQRSLVSALAGMLAWGIIGTVLGGILGLMCAYLAGKNGQKAVNTKVPTAEHMLLLKKRNDSKAALYAFYDLCAVAEIFRNLIPIGCMYYLIENGFLGNRTELYALAKRTLDSRLFMLTGAYLAKNSEPVLKTQPLIYSDICKMNERAAALAENPEVLASYLSERAAKENEYQGYLINIRELS